MSNVQNQQRDNALRNLKIAQISKRNVCICLLTIFPFCQCGNMAREGLRTLVVAKKSLSEEQYQDFEV